MLFAKKQPPLDTSIQAEYADGFVLDETEHDDVSPYEHINDDGEVFAGNILRAIMEKKPEAEHGKLVRLSLFYKNQRHDIDWTVIPDNARPIRFRNFTASWNESDGQMVSKVTNWVDFGFQYTDDAGANQQEVTRY